MGDMNVNTRNKKEHDALEKIVSSNRRNWKMSSYLYVFGILTTLIGMTALVYRVHDSTALKLVLLEQLKSKNVVIDSLQTVALNYPNFDTLERMKRELASLSLPYLYFEYNQYLINQEASFVLMKIYRFLLDDPSIFIMVYAYSDSRGSDEYIMTIPLRRAKSVCDFLVSKGIDRARISYKGFGESRITNNCDNDNYPCTEEQHQENRRVEFILED